MGANAHTPRSQSQWVVGPGRTPQGPTVQRGRAPDPGRITPRQEAARFKDGCSGVGEPRTPETPHPGKRPPPRAPSCCPHSAQSQLARARAVGLVTGLHTHTPHSHSQWVAGPGRTPQGQAVGRGRASSPGCPTPRQKPRQRSKPVLKSARCGVGDGSPSAHLRHPQPLERGPRTQASRTGGQASESAQPRKLRTHARDTPPPGRPRAAPTARKAGSQERALWGR